MPLEPPVILLAPPPDTHRTCHTHSSSLCPNCACRDAQGADENMEGDIGNGMQDKGRDSGPAKSHQATSTSLFPRSSKDMEWRRRKVRRITLPPHLALIGVATASACIMGRYHQVLTESKPQPSWLLLQRLFTTASSWVGLAETVQHLLEEYRPTPFVFIASCLYFGLTLANIYEQLKGRPKHGRRLAILWCGSLVSAFYGLLLGRGGQDVLLLFIPWGLILASTACVLLHPFEEVTLPQEAD